jgi:hypothetical protein
VTYNITIADGTDDAEERVADHSVTVDSDSLDLPYAGQGSLAETEQVAGLRFAVPIPRGAKILRAYLELQAAGTEMNRDPANLIIEGQLAPDAPAFTAAAGNVTSRAPWTKAQVKWAFPSWRSLDDRTTSADLAALLQEITAQAGWAGGNALVLVLRADKGNRSLGRRSVAAYEGNPIATALLHIEAFNPAASQPSPPNGATDVTMPVFEWTQGDYAVAHNVYIGTSPNLTQANLVAPKHPSTTYELTAGLEPGVTYYWRVDEINKDGVTVYPGEVWHFTTRAVAVPPDPTLAGWWKLDDGQGLTAVDSSDWDRQGTLQGNPRWTQGQLGGALSFDGRDDNLDCGSSIDLGTGDCVSVAAWISVTETSGGRRVASNDDGRTGGFSLGISASNKIEFQVRLAPGNITASNRNSPGGAWLEWDTWYHVVGVYEKGKGLRTYLDGRLDRTLTTAEVAGLSTGPLMIGREAHTASNWWAGLLDDVRVYAKALEENEIRKIMQGAGSKAWNPKPKPDTEIDSRQAGALTWSAGSSAAAHDVYLGPSRGAVGAADTTSPLYLGRQTGTSYALAGLLDFGGHYFWRIDEVDADGTTIHPGEIWAFTLRDPVWDDFESYTDDMGHRIFETWLDGSTNDTGARVGHWEAPFAEQTIVHSGAQALPLIYNNAQPPYYSETRRDFANAQDWLAGRANALTLWFRGDPVPLVETTRDKFSLTATGTDIWNASDQFRLAYQRLTGAGTFAVRVESIVNTDPWAKAGVMIRENLDPRSRFAAVFATPENGVRFQARYGTGYGATSDTPIATVSQMAMRVPVWVKIEKTRTAFNGYYSTDGVSWTSMSWNPQTINMPTTVYIGLAVTSHAAGAFTTATFSHPTATGDITGEWQAADIGIDQTDPRPHPLYVAVEDNFGQTAVVTHPNPAATSVPTWTEWKIPLSAFTGVNLTRVQKMYIGVGNRTDPGRDGAGRLYLDDLCLTSP